MMVIIIIIIVIIPEVLIFKYRIPAKLCNPRNVFSLVYKTINTLYTGDKE